MTTEGRERSAEQSRFRMLLLLGVLSCLVYAAIAWLSPDFGYETAGPERPILAVLILLSVAFFGYLAALRIAVRLHDHRGLVAMIWIFSIAFRATLLLTEPFQEIDLYRYIWDGQAVNVGVNPYRYSPAQVLAANADDPLPADLRQLVALRDRDPDLRTILTRIHFEDLTTVYPPVSQAVFAAAAATTPRGADVRTHLAVMKLWITVFDLLTLFFVIRILQQIGKPVGWSLAYGWCPLVIKEFANSGHLDSIAICLTTVSLYFVLKAFFPSTNDCESRGTWTWTAMAGACFGLAVGAKLYPVVLAPLLFVTAWRRRGIRASIAAGVMSAVIAAISLWPMFGVERPNLRIGSADDATVREIAPPKPHDPRSTTFAESELHAGPIRDIDPPIPGVVGDSNPTYAPDIRSDIRTTNPKPTNDGLSAFLSHWKMNDFLFQLVEANVAVASVNEHQPKPWFAVVPESWRLTAVQFTKQLVEVSIGKTVADTEAAFLLARIVTMGLFLLLVFLFAWKSAFDQRRERFLEFVFLTLAWFWLLLPTQNPWYWLCAMPLVAFARGRAWVAMSGLVLIYYLRFWLAYHYAGAPIAGTALTGTQFFDQVVVWLEFGPWFIWLLLEANLSNPVFSPCLKENGRSFVFKLIRQATFSHERRRPHGCRVYHG